MSWKPNSSLPKLQHCNEHQFDGSKIFPAHSNLWACSEGRSVDGSHAMRKSFYGALWSKRTVPAVTSKIVLMLPREKAFPGTNRRLRVAAFKFVWWTVW